ncbi:glutathione-dependent formaldehyde-activating enzyme [Colletotrichum truncatum]|uniref:Glutathione-dependent formaldehyde-activating enzyme n=1 Tax=Colletotrichum truncatum TaxID=5467 RepID=A0ACC3YY00_COLTU|nr:glutathione-dependent formaldehyde-activating enzyme [Colletotrichum truncatum]KAF6790924.1 glutathione-dependent formaldehyde-activating enzyme [Colletotrichum truncatum]
MNVECHCGAVKFPTPAPEPIDIYCCHCSECRRQSASAFGISAIFPADGLVPLSADLESKLQVWTRPTKSGGQMDCYFCRVCGSRIFHHVRESDGTRRSTVSIKGGSIKGLNFKKGKHIWTNNAVIPVPEGAESWPESPPATPRKDEAMEE